jgi:hypothetical protein
MKALVDAAVARHGKLDGEQRGWTTRNQPALDVTRRDLTVATSA